jgi:hypothetical protein
MGIVEKQFHDAAERAEERAEELDPV